MLTKIIQATLLSGATFFGILIAGCSSSGIDSSINQPAFSTSINPPAVKTADRPIGAPSNQPAATPEVATKPAATLGQSAHFNPSNQSPTTQLNDTLAKVAAILGIDQQKLTDAFTQARAEFRDVGRSATPSGMARPAPTRTNMPVPDNTIMPKPTGTVMPAPAGIPGQAPGGNSQPGISNELLARVASILGIDQQKLADAFNQVMTQQ
jgi:hypothetical protein